MLEPGRPARSPGHLLTLTNAGYLLNVESGSVDVDRFQFLVRQARAARCEDRLVEASRLLGEAIGLWQAEALANLSEPLLGTARRRLNELRVAALEEWAEVELDLGHHSRLVPELARLVTEFPLREQLRYLLMLALYRCGRQAEAHSAYRDARGFLVEEFGVEPSKLLQLLHDRMLKTDPALEWRPAGVPADAASQPSPEPSVLAPVASAPEPLPARRASLGEWLGRALVIGVPIISFGLLTWAVIAYLAGRRRSINLGLCALGYFALLVLVMSTLMTNEESDAMQPYEVVGLLGLFVAMLGGATQAAMVSFAAPAPAVIPAASRGGRARMLRFAGRAVALVVPIVSFGLLTWLVVGTQAAVRRSVPLGLAAFGYLGLSGVFLVVFAARATEPLSGYDIVWLIALFLSTFGGTVHVALLLSATYRAPAPGAEPHRPWAQKIWQAPQQDERPEPHR